MFCPNCGANNSTEQKFCRSCGLNLEKSAESLLEQIPSAASAKLLKQQRNLENFGNIAFGGLGLVLITAVGAMIYVIFTKFILSGAGIFVGILLIAFIVFAALTLAYVFFNEDLKERKQKTNPALIGKFEETGQAVNLLEEKPFAPLTSITENSTELFPIESKTKKF